MYSILKLLNNHYKCERSETTSIMLLNSVYYSTMDVQQYLHKQYGILRLRERSLNGI